MLAGSVTGLRGEWDSPDKFPGEFVGLEYLFMLLSF